MLIGRCDNAIKNYWNSTLKHRKLQFECALDVYLKQRLRGDDSDVTEHPILLRKFLSQNIKVAQRQYFDCIRSKISDMRFELDDQPENKILIFFTNLMERGIASPPDKSTENFIFGKMLSSSSRSSKVLSEAYKKH